MAPRVALLQSADRVLRGLDWLLLIGFGLANVALLLLIAEHLNATHFWLGGTLLVFSFGFYLKGALALFAIDKKRVRELPADPARIGRYRVEELKKIVQEVMAPHGQKRREIPAVYLIDQRYDGASVTNSAFFNHPRFQPLNAIYLSRHLLTLLRPDELRAVLSHELGHFYHHMRPLMRAPFALLILHVLLPTWIGGHPNGPGWIVAGLWWVLVTPWWLSFRGWWIRRRSRTQEYLSDLHAARRWGLLPMVNALLLLGRQSQRLHLILETLLSHIEDSRVYDLQKLIPMCEAIDARLPSRWVTADRVEGEVLSFLTDKAAEAFRRPASQANAGRDGRVHKAARQALALPTDFTVIDHRRWDTRLNDGRVDPAEFQRLLELLQDEPSAQLFRSATEDPAAAMRSHPTVRERIEFLESCRAQGLVELTKTAETH